MVEFLLGVPGRLVALGTTLVTGISDILTAIGTRAPANTAVSNAVLTDLRIALLDNLVNIANAPDRTKSRTHHQVSATGTGAVTVILDTPDVSAAKIRIIYLGCWAPSGGTCSGGVYYAGTSVVCQGNTASSGMTWSFIIEELW